MGGMKQLMKLPTIQLMSFLPKESQPELIFQYQFLMVEKELLQLKMQE